MPIDFIHHQLAAHPSRLPSNTLCVTLEPFKRIFYLPSLLPTTSRPPSPSAGYNSDPESNAKTVSVNRIKTVSSTRSFTTDDGSESLVPLSSEAVEPSSPQRKRPRLSSPWPSLMKFVPSIHSVLQYTQHPFAKACYAASMYSRYRGVPRQCCT